MKITWFEQKNQFNFDSAYEDISYVPVILSFQNNDYYNGIIGEEYLPGPNALPITVEKSFTFVIYINETYSIKNPHVSHYSYRFSKSEMFDKFNKNKYTYGYEHYIISESIDINYELKHVKKHVCKGRIFRTQKEKIDTTFLVIDVIKMCFDENSKINFDIILCFNILTNERVFFSLKNEKVKEIITKNSIKYI